MNPEQLEEQVLTNSRDITALKETTKSAHKRIDKNEALINQIHKLTTSIETLAYQLKAQGERMEEMVKSQQNQGQRIGALEKKPAMRWEALVTQLIGLIVAAAFGAAVVKFM